MADKTAKVVWQGDMTFEGLGSTYPDGKVIFDSDESVGGHNQGFRPLEMLIMGLAGCTAMDVLSILKKKRQDVTAFEVEVEGIQATEHPKCFTDIALVYRVTGHDVDPKAVDRAIELSETRYCGASCMLSKAATITHRVEIIEAAPA